MHAYCDCLLPLHGMHAVLRALIMTRAALNEHAKDCDFQPNTDCDACFLWRQMDGHTTKGQVCFKTGSDENHVKVRRRMVDSRTVP